MTFSRLATNSLAVQKVNSGILGFGNWATITSVTGSPTTATYTDSNGVSWKYYQWYNSDVNNSVSGSLVVAGDTGLIDILLVSAGGYCNGGGDTGNGGNVVSGLRLFAAGTHNVFINSAVNGGTTGPSAILGSYLSPVTADAINTAGAVGAGGTAANRYLGFTSSITGSSVEYGPANSNTAIGGGGRTGVNEYGRNGAVIVRVPSSFAQA